MARPIQTLTDWLANDTEQKIEYLKSLNYFRISSTEDGRVYILESNSAYYPPNQPNYQPSTNPVTATNFCVQDFHPNNNYLQNNAIPFPQIAPPNQPPIAQPFNVTPPFQEFFDKNYSAVINSNRLDEIKRKFSIHKHHKKNKNKNFKKIAFNLHKETETKFLKFMNEQKFNEKNDALLALLNNVKKGSKLNKDFLIETANIYKERLININNDLEVALKNTKNTAIELHKENEKLRYKNEDLNFLKEAFSEFLLKTYNNNLDNSQRFTQEEVESLIKKIIIQKRSEHQQKTAQNQDNQSKDIIELSDNIHLINKN